jgi:glycosyltransferase involved in cell wall biosynthesis
MRIQLITKPGSGMTGISRYTENLYKGLKTAGVDVHLTFPDPVLTWDPAQRGLKRLGLDVEAFFASYPLRARLDGSDVYHLTGQTLATLLLSQRVPGRVVVTVHDIIPYLVRHYRELNTLRHPFDYLFYRLALIGLRRADALVAVSNYTKQTVVEALGIAPERIHVVHEVVEHERFRPLAVPETFRAKYGLDNGTQYILHVGSDDPRKNLASLVRALAQVKRQVSHVKLLKVGAPHFERERQRLLALVAELGLQDDVLFFGQVPEAELPLFYNVADLLVMPSLHEGFGLPVLEAMACGKPVIVSDRGSLPEVGGNAVLTINPIDVEMLAAQITYLLENREYAHWLGQAGYQRAQTFQSARQAEATIAIYTGLERAK